MSHFVGVAFIPRGDYTVNENYSKEGQTLENMFSMGSALDSHTLDELLAPYNEQDDTYCEINPEINEVATELLQAYMNKDKEVVDRICNLNIKFPLEITSRGYLLHVTALETSFKKGSNYVHYEKYPHVSCEDAGSNRLAIQRFKTPFSNPGKEFKINFPIDFGTTPIVSATIEGVDTNVEYAIFSVNKSSYNIIFSKEINNFTVHTFSSISGYKGF